MGPPLIGLPEVRLIVVVELEYQLKCQHNYITNFPTPVNDISHIFIFL